jgi:hypothetical protein
MNYRGNCSHLNATHAKAPNTRDTGYVRYVDAVGALWTWLAEQLSGNHWHVPKCRLLCLQIAVE